MKKFLSLVLALVMTMSLVTISAGAEYADASEMDYNEAVDVLTALEVVGGYGDNTFREDNTLTRGAAAKYICNMLLGAKTTNTLVASAAPYVDVPAGSTYAPYVAYLKSEGMVGGYGDGTFRAGVEVTGFQFAKMVLGALGLDAEIEKFGGANWSINVAKWIAELELDDGIADFNGAALITRGEAAQLCLNALKTNVYGYDKNEVISIGDVTISQNSEAKKGDKTFAEKNQPKLDWNDDATDAFGRPATSWTLTGYGDDDKIGTYAQTADKVYTAAVKAKDLYADLDLTKAYTFKEVYEDGKEAPDFKAVKKGDELQNETVGNPGVLTEVFYEVKDNKVVEAAIVSIVPYIAQIDKVDENEEDERIVEIDDMEYVTEEFEEDQWVIFTLAWNDTEEEYEIKSMVAAEKLTGTVTKLVGSDEVYIDGVKYVKADKDIADIDAVAVKDEVEFYVVNDHILKLDLASTSVTLDNLAYVEYADVAGGYEGGYKATLRLADGTKKIVETDINYSAVPVEDSEETVSYIGEIVLFEENDDGEYELTLKTTESNVDTTVEFKKGEPSFKVAEGEDPISTNSKTVFVYAVAEDDDPEDVDYTVYTGYKNAPSVVSYVPEEGEANADNVVAYNKDGVAVLVYVYVEAADIAATASDKTFVFYDADVKSVDDGDTTVYYEYNAIVDGEITTVKVNKAVKDDMVANGTITNAYNSLNYNSKGVATSVGGDYAMKSATAVKAAENDVLSLTVGGSAKAYAWADDVAVYFVDDDFVITEGDIDDISKGDTTDDYDQILFVTDKDDVNTLELVIIVEK